MSLICSASSYNTTSGRAGGCFAGVSARSESFAAAIARRPVTAQKKVPVARPPRRSQSGVRTTGGHRRPGRYGAFITYGDPGKESTSSRQALSPERFQGESPRFGGLRDTIRWCDPAHGRSYAGAQTDLASIDILASS